MVGRQRWLSTAGLFVVVAQALVLAPVVPSATTPRADAVGVQTPSCPTGSVLVDYTYSYLYPAMCQIVFTEDGTFTTPAGVSTVDVVAVGGGGGGGAGGVVGGEVLAGGGGGGGQVALYEDVPVSGSIAVTVGSGGAGGLDSCTPTCSTASGVDGDDGGSSEFGTGGTYEALGGLGGEGGSATLTSPFVTSGSGGASPGVAPTSAPATVTSTVSSGGDGGAAAGGKYGKPGSVYYFSGAGGGAGAGGVGAAARIGGCITRDGGTACEVRGGNGGKGSRPNSTTLNEYFWSEWFKAWSTTNLGARFDATVTGFGPGGGGSVTGIWVWPWTDEYPTIEPGPGIGVQVSGEPLSSLSGMGAFGNGDFDLGDYPNATSGTDFDWSSAPFALGGGGGGAVGNPVTMWISPDLADGSDGTDGIVIVVFELPLTTPTTTTYTGDSGSFDAGDSLELSATVAPAECSSPAVTYTLTYPDASTETVTDPLDTTGFDPGTYTITADYAGDSTCGASSDSAEFVIRTPTTTTYTGDDGSFDAGDSLELSATVAPAECSSPAVTYTLTYPDASTATVTDPLDTTGFDPGTYTITADYAGDSDCSPSSDSAEFVIRSGSTTTYTGDTGVVLAGTLVTLSASISPAECSGMDVSYQIVYPNGDVYDVGSPLNTAGFSPGIYEIIASTDADDATCLPSEDRALLVIATPGDSTTGGGVYHVDSSISGTPRINFGFTVQQTEKYDKRTNTREITQRGSLLWINTNKWRLKASLYSRTVNGVTSGGLPVFGTTSPCPGSVGVSGSNPKCGFIVGSGWLQRWNEDTLEWEIATDLGRSGWVSFSATIYDGGSVKVCKGKTCSIVDVTDWFGMTMAGITTSTGVPVSVPVEVRKQRNGAIVIRV